VIVLDTHAWIWWADKPELLSKRTRRAIDEVDTIGISSFSCYEVARSAARGRVTLHPGASKWIGMALHLPKVVLLDLTPQIAVAAAELDWQHGDPFDRMIVATAMAHGARIVSKDDRIRLFPPARAIW